jgi:hypothetical protein
MLSFYQDPGAVDDGRNDQLLDASRKAAALQRARVDYLSWVFRSKNTSCFYEILCSVRDDTVRIGLGFFANPIQLSHLGFA